MFSSRMTAYFRRKGVAVTDGRVQKMNEILSYIKFIKMYAWVKAFSGDVQSTRSPDSLPPACCHGNAGCDLFVLPVRDPR